MAQAASRKYETVVILQPELNENQLKDEQKKIEGLLTQNGATNINVDKWGKKEIAYEVKKQKLGNFLSFNYESAEHSVVQNVTNILRITDSVLKFQTHKLNEKTRKFKGNPKRAGSALGSDDFMSEDF